jgi:hypothetical protein
VNPTHTVILTAEYIHTDKRKMAELPFIDGDIPPKFMRTVILDNDSASNIRFRCQNAVGIVLRLAVTVLARADETTRISVDLDADLTAQPGLVFVTSEDVASLPARSRAMLAREAFTRATQNLVDTFTRDQRELVTWSALMDGVLVRSRSDGRVWKRWQGTLTVLFASLINAKQMQPFCEERVVESWGVTKGVIVTEGGEGTISEGVWLGSCVTRRGRGGEFDFDVDAAEDCLS